ncbi:MAG: ABC transporter substrate-binding protein [Deltaproteobacteria bacterium]|nr:ABC transporter substrate-binding protein [Deltaproteobacteria bacterium]
MKTTLLTALLLAFLAFPPRARAEDCVAKTIMDQAYTEILQVVTTATDDESMRTSVRTIMARFIDFTEFGSLSMGSHWAALTVPQRDLYLVEFKELLKRTYLRRFERGKKFVVTYRSGCRMNSTGDRLEIQTVIHSADDVEADVDYRFHKTVSGWLVYDIVVDEVSVMRNYRKTFVETYEKEGFDRLIEKMRSKKSDRDEDDAR